MTKNCQCKEKFPAKFYSSGLLLSFGTSGKRGWIFAVVRGFFMPMIYLVRHGYPAWPQGKYCFSRTDAPLNEVGKEQAQALRNWFLDKPAASVWTSCAKRCRQTAALALSQPAWPLPLLEEVCVGQWEGLSFDEIRARYPEIYQARGEDPAGVAPPGGETFLEAGERLRRVMDERCDAQGDTVLVCHGGLIRGLLCLLGAVPREKLLDCCIPYGSITILQKEQQQIKVLAIGRKPCRYPRPLEEKQLVAQCRTPVKVLRHSQAVAACAARLAEGRGADLAFLMCCARLHDLCREQGRQHPQQAARLLRSCGWWEMAEVVEQHHDLGASPSVEAELLCLADRMTEGEQIVSLKARFQASRQKCDSKEALEARQRRWQETLELAEKYGLDPDAVYAP